MSHIMGDVMVRKHVAALVMVAGLVAGCSGSQGESESGESAVTGSQEASWQENASAVPTQSFVKGAEEGDAQRSWPRRFFDDSSYRPGTWSVTPQGDPIYTPINSLGDPLGVPTDRDEISECKKDAVRVPNKITIEYIHGRFLLFSDTDGPGKSEGNGILTDYAKTPAGAMLAASNFLNYTMVAADDLGRTAGNDLVLSD